MLFKQQKGIFNQVQLEVSSKKPKIGVDMQIINQQKLESNEETVCFASRRHESVLVNCGCSGVMLVYKMHSGHDIVADCITLHVDGEN